MMTNKNLINSASYDSESDLEAPGLVSIGVRCEGVPQYAKRMLHLNSKIIALRAQK